MVSQASITDRDRKAINAIARGEPDLGIDPADFPTWSNRPEIQPALKVAYWLEERRARIDVRQSIKAAIDHLHAALDQRPPVTSITHLAETRRAAVALAELALSVLYGPPRRRAAADARGPSAPGNPTSLSALARELASTGAPGGVSNDQAARPDAPATEGAAHSTSPALPPTRESTAVTDAAPVDHDPAHPRGIGVPPVPTPSPSRPNAHHAPRTHNAHTRTQRPSDASLSIPNFPSDSASSLSALSAISAVKPSPLSLAARAGTTDTS